MGRKSDAGERILISAASLFWRKGFEAVGTDEICREAGINKGTLYHFHENKKQLALAVIQRNADTAAGFMDARLAGKKPDEQILGYLRLARELQQAQVEESGLVLGCPFGNLSAEMAGRDEDIADAVADFFRMIMGFIASNLRDLYPSISPRRAENEAREIFTYWEGALLMAKTMNDPILLDGALRKIKKTIKDLGA